MHRIPCSWLGELVGTFVDFVLGWPSQKAMFTGVIEFRWPMKPSQDLCFSFPFVFVLDGPYISVASKLLSPQLEIPGSVSKQLWEYKAYFQKNVHCLQSWITECTNVKACCKFNDVTKERRRRLGIRMNEWIIKKSTLLWENPRKLCFIWLLLPFPCTVRPLVSLYADYAEG